MAKQKLKVKKKKKSISFNNPLKIIDNNKDGNITVLLHKKVHNVIRYIMNSPEYMKKEWQFMFRVDMSDPDYYKICDYFIIDQYNGGSTTRSTDNFREGMTAWIFENDMEDELNEWCGWYHSHNTMQTFRSSQDRQTMYEHLEGADIQMSLVSGLSDEEGDNIFDGVSYRCALSVAKGYDVTMDNLKVELYSDEKRDSLSETVIQIGKERAKKEKALAEESAEGIKSILKGYIPKGLPVRNIDEYNMKLDAIKEEANEKYIEALTENDGLYRYMGDVALEDLKAAEKVGEARDKENNKHKYTYNKKNKHTGANLFSSSGPKKIMRTCACCGLTKDQLTMTVTKDGAYVCDKCEMAYGHRPSKQELTSHMTKNLNPIDDVIPVYKRPIKPSSMDKCDCCSNYITLGENMYSVAGIAVCEECYDTQFV